MTLMSDTLKRGITFDGASGLKTGANLEDLVTRAHLTSGSQLLDQSSVEDFADPSLVDDYGAALRRIRVKAGGITGAMLSQDAFFGGPSLMTSIFGNAAGAAAAMQTVVLSAGSSVSTPATDIANIFDGNIATSWTEAVQVGDIAYYWDLGAVYRGNLFFYGDLKVTTANSNFGYLHFRSTISNVPASNTEEDYMRFFSNSTYATFGHCSPFCGRYVGFGVVGPQVGSKYVLARRFEVYGALLS